MPTIGEILESKERRIRIGLVLGGLHLLLVAYVVFLIFSGRETDWPMYWNIFIFLDFPISLLWILTTYVLNLMLDTGGSIVPIVPYPANDFSNFLLPLFFCGVIGTLWYFFLPNVLRNLLKWK